MKVHLAAPNQLLQGYVERLGSEAQSLQLPANRRSRPRPGTQDLDDLPAREYAGLVNPVFLRLCRTWPAMYPPLGHESREGFAQTTLRLEGLSQGLLQGGQGQRSGRALEGRQ